MSESDAALYAANQFNNQSKTNSALNNMLRSLMGEKQKATVSQRLKELFEVDDILAKQDAPINTVYDAKQQAMDNQIAMSLSSPLPQYEALDSNQENLSTAMINTNAPNTRVERSMNGGLMAFSPQARMQQGLMQTYRPPIKMNNGGVANSGSYFGSDEDQILKAANNLRESIAREKAREASTEVVGPFRRFGEGFLDVFGFSGEDSDDNKGDLQEEITELYTDSFYEDAPRQTEKRIKNREEIKEVIDNATSDQLLSINEAIQSGKAPQDADALRSMLISGVEEDQNAVSGYGLNFIGGPKGADDPSTESDESKIQPIVKGATTNTVDTQSNTVDTQSNAVDSSLVTTGDLFEDAKKAKDPESFVDSLSSIDLLRMAAGYLGTTSVTAGTKGALTNLLKGKEADKAHDLAVKKADSIDEYYKGLLKSQRRGQDLTYSAALAKTLENQGIDQETYLDTVKDIASEYNELLLTKVPSEFLNAVEKIDQSAGQLLRKLYEENKTLPTTEEVISIIAMKRINASRSFSGPKQGSSSLIKSFKVK